MGNFSTKLQIEQLLDAEHAFLARVGNTARGRRPSIAGIVLLESLYINHWNTTKAPWKGPEI